MPHPHVLKVLAKRPHSLVICAEHRSALQSLLRNGWRQPVASPAATPTLLSCPCRCQQQWHDGLDCQEAQARAKNKQLFDLVAQKHWRQCKGCGYESVSLFPSSGSSCWHTQGRNKIACCCRHGIEKSRGCNHITCRCKVSL